MPDGRFHASASVLLGIRADTSSTTFMISMPTVDSWCSVPPGHGSFRSSGAHFHDLRHTGGTLTATTGATAKEVMARLGHSSPRAAMIYQHATRDRGKTIARSLGKLTEEARDAE